jgi:hypothetical protein
MVAKRVGDGSQFKGLGQRIFSAAAFAYRGLIENRKFYHTNRFR